MAVSGWAALGVPKGEVKLVQRDSKDLLEEKPVGKGGRGHSWKRLLGS